MSLAIQLGEVEAVLIAGRWYGVAAGTFCLDSYEFLHDDDFLIHGGGGSGVCATGFEFDAEDEDGPIGTIAGPLDAIQAVRRGARQ